MNRPSYLLLFGALLLGACLVTGITNACTSQRAGFVSVHSPKAESDGYILLAPYRIDLVPGKIAPPGVVQLIDRNGIVVHEWHTEAPVLVPQLERNGTLFVSMTPPTDHRALPGFGTTGIIQQLSWDGKVLWEQRDPLMTLDYEPLPDGSLAYLRWSKTPEWFAGAVQGGFSTATSSVWANDIVVVNKNHEQTWVWRMSDHVSPSQYRVSSSVAHQEFAHANSLRYVEDNPITHTPAFVLSARHLSKVFIIDAKTGKVLWESPDGLFSLQHDAILLPNGTMTVFDNGFGKAGAAALFSRALEIRVPEGVAVWSYDGGTSVSAKVQFASSIMGSVERLENGNTFITLSTEGRVLEVTPEGQVVWDFHDTFHDTDGEARLLFRARFYYARGKAWANNLPIPALSSALFCRVTP